ncbi:MAG: hypothetical protein WCP12_17490, partial [bacterium]
MREFGNAGMGGASASMPAADGEAAVPPGTLCDDRGGRRGRRPSRKVPPGKAIAMDKLPERMHP